MRQRCSSYPRAWSIRARRRSSARARAERRDGLHAPIAWSRCCRFYTSPGFCTELIHSSSATDLRTSTTSRTRTRSRSSSSACRSPRRSSRCWTARSATPRPSTGLLAYWRRRAGLSAGSRGCRAVARPSARWGRNGLAAGATAAQHGVDDQAAAAAAGHDAVAAVADIEHQPGNSLGPSSGR